MSSTATLCPYLWGWELGGDAPISGGSEELLPQDGLELLGQDLLLLHAAVILQGQDHWVVRGLGSNVHKWRSASVELRSSHKGFAQAAPGRSPLCVLVSIPLTPSYPSNPPASPISHLTPTSPRPHFTTAPPADHVCVSPRPLAQHGTGL